MEIPGPRDLARAVRCHIPGDDESSHAAAIRLLGTGQEMWRRTEYQPGHFTVSGFVMSPDGSAVMLVHHTKLGRWLQPGGHIEKFDRTIEDAIRREVAEETGLVELAGMGTGLLRIDAHPIPGSAEEPNHVHVDLSMGFRADTAAASPLDGVTRCQWVSFESLEEWDTDEAVHAGARLLRASVP